RMKRVLHTLTGIDRAGRLLPVAPARLPRARRYATADADVGDRLASRVGECRSRQVVRRPGRIGVDLVEGRQDLATRLGSGLQLAVFLALGRRPGYPVAHGPPAVVAMTEFRPSRALGELRLGADADGHAVVQPAGRHAHAAFGTFFQLEGRAARAGRHV